MTVGELIEELEEYNIDAEVQVSIADGYEVIGCDEIGFDDEYDKEESCVITVNTDKR